jgi:hypothetical protein
VRGQFVIAKYKAAFLYLYFSGCRGLQARLAYRCITRRMAAAYFSQRTVTWWVSPAEV